MNSTDNELRLVISTATEPGNGLPAEIAFNYDELKAKLTAHVSKYDGLVVQDGDIAGARRIRAEINGMIGDLKEAGARVKKSWNSPLDTFLGRVKELIQIAKPIEEKIGSQIKAYDAEKREARRNEIGAMLLEIVNEAVKDDDDEIARPFIESEHWSGCIKAEMLTQSSSLARTKAQLEAEVRRCRDQVLTATRLYAKRGMEWAVKASYALARWDYDALTAFNDVDRQIAEAERIAQRKAAEAARKAESKEAEASPASNPSPEDVAKAALAAKRAAKAEVNAAATAPVESVPVEAEDILTYTLKITGPRSKLFALRDWLMENGLTFARA